MTYNKLVRDRIPDIINDAGKTCRFRTLKDDEYITMLDEKLNEELAEYQESKSIEELADLWEVMRAVVRTRGFTLEQLETVRVKKEQKRGAFNNRIMLLEVTENEAIK